MLFRLSLFVHDYFVFAVYQAVRYDVRFVLNVLVFLFEIHFHPLVEEPLKEVRFCDPPDSRIAGAAGRVHPHLETVDYLEIPEDFILALDDE